jgi:hypothetical protein
MPMIKINNWERFLKLIFGTSLFVVLCMGGLAYKYIKELSRSFEMVQHAYEVNLELGDLRSSLDDAESGHRGFLISKDSVFLESFLSKRKEIYESLGAMKEETFDNPQQQEDLKELKILIDNRFELLNEAREIVKTSKLESPEFIEIFKQGRQAMEHIRLKIHELISHEKSLLNIRKDKSSKNLSTAPLLVYYILIFSLILLLLTYAQISKNLKKLKEKNELLETFKESSTQSEIVSKHGNWVWHVEENRFEYSDNLYRLLGEAPQSFEANLENFMSFVHPEDVAKLSEQVEKMLEEVDLPFIYYRIIQKNGRIKHFKAYGKVLIDSDGDRRLLGTTADITDEIETFRLIEERNTELERNNKELASFNYVASHDLQEPLRKIQTFISRIEEKEYDTLSDNGKLYLDRIKTSSFRMRSLIDDLLQFSKTNKSDQVFEVSNINLLLENAQQDLAELILEKNAKIISDPIPEMLVIPFQIKQLFLNLISNSLKYSRDNTPPIIDISYSKTKATDLPKLKFSKHKFYHTINVKDNGIGFEEDYAEKIFVLFNRLHNKNEFSGTGIGLSICKKIMENHSGFIFADGHTGEGATFTVYLPFE